jgi:hypothetical protein
MAGAGIERLHFVENDSRTKQKPVFVGNTVGFHEIVKFL